MISFRTRNDAAAGVLMIVGLILLIGTAGWIFAIKLPDKQTVASQPASIDDEAKKIEETGRAISATQNAINELLWSEGADKVAPAAFADINKLSMADHLKVTAFRPQKPSDVAGMTQIPFALTVDGTYPDTMKFVKDLETTETKLAINLVQVNTAESSTDHVTGTINFVAYLKAAPAPAATPKRGKGA